MNESSSDVQRFLERLRRRLPLSARARAELIPALRTHGSKISTSRDCMVTGVFDAGDELGVLCQIELGAAESSRLLVVPIKALSFKHRDRPVRMSGTKNRHKPFRET